jgi:hypothetical protein
MAEQSVMSFTTTNLHGLTFSCTCVPTPVVEMTLDINIYKMSGLFLHFVDSGLNGLEIKILMPKHIKWVKNFSHYDMFALLN